jgi:hypothetical protein
MPLSQKQLPFRIVTVAVLSALTVPFLVRDGMFLDGILYATVAHHLARGIGTFWFPIYSKTVLVGHSTFHEQPPLGFAIQALFYRIAGQGLYTERIYTGIMLCLTAAMIAGLWSRIHRNDRDIAAMGWLPVLLWIVIPVCSWSYRNDMCENTMGIFTLAAMWLLYDNMDRAKPSFLRYIMAGAIIFCASLTKGIPGLFPLAFPVLYLITTRRASPAHALYATACILITLVAIYLIILSFPDARSSMHIYVYERLLGRVKGDPTVGSHFSIIGSLLGELLIPLILCMIVAVYQRVRPAVQKQTKLDPVFLFLLIGLSGSLPLMLTKVQKAFYFVAALPFFAIAAALYVAPIMSSLVAFISGRVALYRGIAISGIIALLVVLGISVHVAGTPYRDQDMLHDIYIMGDHMGRGTSISATEVVKAQFSIQCYLMRYFDISYSNPGEAIRYHLTEKGYNRADTLWRKEDWSLKIMDVYESAQ